jgi:hypothetical protein
MPLNEGCWLDQDHDVHGARPNPVEPYPVNPVRAEEPEPTRPLTPQDGHLMPKGDELQFQGSAAPKAEGEQ